MTMNTINPYDNDGLQQLVELLENTHYNTVLVLSEQAKKQAARLHELEVRQATSQYVTMCNRLIDQIQTHIKSKKESFLPYLRSLFEKEEKDHDCRNCNGTGACSLQHEMHLGELKHSLIRLKDIINSIQMVALPLYSDTIYPDAYRILRNQMALLENSLTELYFFEETNLLPKVAEAQKNIHARS